MNVNRNAGGKKIVLTHYPTHKITIKHHYHRTTGC